MSTRKASEVLDKEFLTIRAGLISIGAALDRIDRAEGAADDNRLDQIKQALPVLAEDTPDRAERVQMIFSLPHDEEE